MEINLIFGIITLIMSVVIHEVSHGYVALFWGDPTAKLNGRLTLNPLKHLDLVGSIIIPAMTLLIGGLVFGWAKPVPINPHNMRSKRWGEFWVALAGPLSNITIALFFALIVRIFGDSLTLAFISFSLVVIYINVTLAMFNMIPIPPLDGSKVIFNLFPSLNKIKNILEKYFFVFIIIFVFFLWGFIAPIIPKIVSFLLGV